MEIQEAKESSTSPDFKDRQLSLEKLFFKKEYLIEAHFYVKGRFNLHFPDSVKPSSIPKFGLCSEETGSTNQKNLNIQTFPQTPTVRRHQRFCLCIYHLGIFW